jgi:branched-chain amino acid transport system permease protein
MERTKVTLLAILLIGLILPFLMTNPYYLKVVIVFVIFSILALSLNFIVGYIGEISFGHAAFFGLGAYFSVLLNVHLEMSFWWSFLISLLLTGVVGLIVGFLSFRLQGVHFAIVTLAFAEIFRLIILNLVDLTRGAMGISVSRPHLPFTQTVLGDIHFYYFVFLMLILVIALIHFIIRTPFGRGMVAIRESTILAKSVGINVTRYKLIAFTISSIIAGLAGILYAPFIGVITPTLLSVHYTATGLLMVIVGGKGYLFGPLYGAFIFTVIPEVLWMSPEAKLLVFGFVLLLSILFMPRGIAYWMERSFAKKQEKSNVTETAKEREVS